MKRLLSMLIALPLLGFGVIENGFCGSYYHQPLAQVIIQPPVYHHPRPYFHSHHHHRHHYHHRPIVVVPVQPRYYEHQRGPIVVVPTQPRYYEPQGNVHSHGYQQGPIVHGHD